jgi:hypothetical protein
MLSLSNSVTTDFTRPLPANQGYDCIPTITDCLSSDVHIILMNTTINAEDPAQLFFDNGYCEKLEWLAC